MKISQLASEDRRERSPNCQKLVSLKAMSKTLQDLIDESIFISTEYQARLAEISGGSDWSVDFSAPSFTLASDVSVSLTPYLLGTESENRGTWIWSWQELGHFPDAVVSAAIQARESGASHEISELTTDEIPLTEGIARKLTLATKALTGIYAHYPVTAGAGVRAWILVDGPQLELEPPTVNRMGRVMAEALKTNTAVNQQRAVDSYARLRGAHIEWDTQATAVITTTDGALRLWFDENKISGIEPAEPTVGADVLARCAENAVALREQLLAERLEFESLANQEAEVQVAAREEEHAAAVAQREAEALEAARREQEAREQAERESAERVAALVAAQDEDGQVEEIDQFVEEDEEIEGVVTTDRVYPNAEEPYNQEPSQDAKPGRVTTSAISEDNLVVDEEISEEPVAEVIEPAVEENATESAEVAEEQATEKNETVEETRKPAAFRVAGSAPDLEAEREEAERAPKKEAPKEKKGFFSRFFGL